MGVVIYMMLIKIFYSINYKQQRNLRSKIILLQFVNRQSIPCGIKPQGIYVRISVPSLKVKRTSSLLKTVIKSTRLYH